MRLLTIALVFVFSFHAPIFAGDHIPEIIIFQGKTYKFYNNILEDYFKEHPDKRPIDLQVSGLWRGYVTTYVLVNNQLYIKDIKSEVITQDRKKTKTAWKSIMHEVFPDQKLVKIDWLTGILELPFGGKAIKCNYMGFYSDHKYYYLLEMKNGIMNRFKKLSCENYAKYKRNTLLAFRNTDRYRLLYKTLMGKNNMDKKLVEKDLKDNVFSYTSRFLVD